MSVRITVFNTHRRRRAHAGSILAGVRRVLRKEGIRAGDLRIVFIDSRRSRHLNKTYHARDEATDVLSFPLGDAGAFEGEVYVNLDRAASQARDYGVSRTHEAARLAVHGVLHLAGWNDSTAAERAAMHGEEDRHLEAALGRPSSGRRRRT